MHRIKLLFATLTAAFLLAALVETAAANRLSISNSRFRATWAALAMTPFEISCSVTLEGSFHSATFRKTAGAPIGAVTRGIVKTETCTNATVTILQEQLPWQIHYSDFKGTLPSISSVGLDMVGFAIRLRISLFEVACLLRSEVEQPFSVDAVIANVGTGVITGLAPATSTILPFTGLCSFLGVAAFEGPEGRFTQLGSTATIAIRLI
jgi:hypothetical protein